MGEISTGGGANVFSSGPGSGSKGLAVTASATADTKGSIVELDASTEAEAIGFSLFITSYTFVSAVPVSFLLDIMIGAASSEVVKVEGVHFYSDNSEANNTVQEFHFPLKLPSGTRVSANLQNNVAAANAVNVMMNFDSPSFMSNSGFGACVSHGVDDVNTNGATFDPGGTINTKGAWSEVVASSVGHSAGFLVSIGANLNTSQDSANWQYDVGVGSLGNEIVIAENLYTRSTSQEQLMTTGRFYARDIPEGSRIVIRANSEENDATDRVRSYVFHRILK